MFISLFLVAQAFAAEPRLELVGAGKSVSVTATELKQKFKARTLEIDDPVSKSKKTYDAILLTDVLSLLPGEQKRDEIIFTSQDGYAPNMNAQILAKHKAYLAYQEHGGKPGYFANVDQGKTSLSPGPFYVIWEDGEKAGDVPWPYQLVKIEQVDFGKKYPHVFATAANDSARRGFLLFKDKCLRCHSVNLEGGDIGPELNIPKNVTEYCKPEVLRAFIQQASAFRAKSKMPDFTTLSAAQVGDVIAYLNLMAGHKVKAQ